LTKSNPTKYSIERQWES